ncbi:hypothetical protein ACHAWF_014294 [Thalassiosira exigua]
MVGCRPKAESLRTAEDVDHDGQQGPPVVDGRGRGAPAPPGAPPGLGRSGDGDPAGGEGGEDEGNEAEGHNASGGDRAAAPDDGTPSSPERPSGPPVGRRSRPVRRGRIADWDERDAAARGRRGGGRRRPPLGAGAGGEGGPGPRAEAREEAEGIDPPRADNFGPQERHRRALEEKRSSITAGRRKTSPPSRALPRGSGGRDAPCARGSPRYERGRPLAPAAPAAADRRCRRRKSQTRRRPPPPSLVPSLQMERKFLSRETAQALETVRAVVAKFPEYGVVDLLGTYRMPCSSISCASGNFSNTARDRHFSGMHPNAPKEVRCDDLRSNYVRRSPKDVIWSIVALSRLQRVSDSTGDERRNVATNAAAAAKDRELLGELVRYCAFANAAYGWKGFWFTGRWHFGEGDRVLVRSTGIDRRDIVTANWHSKANRPAYYVARDVGRKSIVLSIRGSLSPRDILTDLCASSENFLVEDGPNIGDVEGASAPPLLMGRAHKGMVDAARSVARMTGKVISDELEARPDYDLVIVGHSLGGGVAAVVAAMWRRRFQGRVRSIGYGNPCVFPPDVAREFGDHIVSVQGDGDPFATISLGHLADATKALSELSRDRSLRDEVLRRTGTGTSLTKGARPEDLSPADRAWCADAMASLRTRMDSEKLFPPGRIYRVSGPWLELPPPPSMVAVESREDRSVKVEAARLEPMDVSAYGELKLHPRMFDLSLHIPVRYETLLRRLASSKEEEEEEAAKEAEAARR